MAKWSNPIHNRHVLIVANYTITVVMDSNTNKARWRIEAGDEWAGGICYRYGQGETRICRFSNKSRK